MTVWPDLNQADNSWPAVEQDVTAGPAPAVEVILGL